MLPRVVHNAGAPAPPGQNTMDRQGEATRENTLQQIEASDGDDAGMPPHPLPLPMHAGNSVDSRPSGVRPGVQQVYLNDSEVANMNMDQEVRIQKRRCCQRCTDCCFKSPQFGAIWRWFCWTLWHIVIVGDTFGIVYIGYKLRDNHPKIMGVCALLFLAPWIIAWAGGLSIKEHIFSHKNFRCRCLVQPFAAIYTVLPPLAIVFMLVTELLLALEGFLQRFLAICFSPRNRTRYYEWKPTTAWWRYRRLTQLVGQTILQLGLYAYIYLEVADDEPFEELLFLENDTLYAAAGVSALGLIFGILALCVGARQTRTTFCGYVTMSQRVTPGFISGENRKKMQFDWSLFKFDEYSFASAIKILHARHEAGKIYTVVITPKSIKKLNHMTCKHFGEVMRKLNTNLIVKHSIHTPHEVWRVLAKRDDFIPNDDIRKKLIESGYASNFPAQELDDILNASRPGGGRLYYSQFKEQIQKSMPLSSVLRVRNPSKFAQDTGDEKMVQLLLGYGAEASNQKSALFHAIETGNLQLIKHIFDAGDLPTQEDFKLTAGLLIRVTQENDLQTAQLVCNLIRDRRFENTGNPLLQKDTYGNTPLHYAAELGRLELVQLYVQAFTQQEQEIMMAPNRSNQTPIRLAQMTNQVQVVDFLRQFQA